MVGGIALVGATGNGTWEYSLDNGVELHVRWARSRTVPRCCCPAPPSCATRPVGTDSETATITYRAWDTTSGAGGDHVDLSQASAVGGTTAFSSATDTASLIVNDAPVLTPGSPFLGTTDEDTTITIGLGTFINNGAGTTVDHRPQSERRAWAESP